MKTHSKTISRILLAVSMIAGAALTVPAATTKLTVPTPTASKGSYSSYVKVTWPKVSGASGYFVYRGSSSNWSAASKLTKITSASTLALNDSSATAGKTYYYWVCPYKGNTYYYNTGKYDSGYRKATASVSMSSYSVSAGTKVYVYYKKGSSYAMPSSMTYSQSTAGTGTAYIYRSLSGNACGYVTTAKAGTITVNCDGVSTKLTVTAPSYSYSYSIECSSSVKVGNSIALWCMRGDGTCIKPTWSVSSSTYATVSSSVISGGSGTLTGKKAGSVTLYAVYGGMTVASKTITVTGGSSATPSSSSGYSISGSTTIKYGSSYKFTLYHNGKKVSNAKWSVGSYLSKSVSGGVLKVKPTSKPVTYNYSTIYALVNGKKVGSKSVKIIR